MLSVLLVILKIIVLTIAILLGVAVILLLALLFLPFCYRFYGKYEEEGYIEGNVRWLLFVIHFKTTYEQEELTYDLKSFGYTIYSNRKEWQECKKKKSEVKKNSKIKKKEKHYFKKKRIKEIKQETEKINVSKTSEMTKKSLVLQDSLNEKNEVDKQKSKNKKKTPLFTSIATILGKIRFILIKLWSVFSFLFYFPWKVKDSILIGIEKAAQLWKKIKPILSKIKIWKRFLQEKSTKTALKHIGGHLKYLWKGVKPKKFYGELHFGFEEPDKTGKILGLAGSVYGMIRKYVNIIPYFEKKILQGSFYGKGKIQLFHIVKTGFRVYKDKLLRHKWKQIQRLMEQ